MKVIEVIADSGHADTVAGIAAQQEVVDYWRGSTDEDGPGGITWRETYAYDANGNRTLYERDADGDGVTDSRSAYNNVTINK